MANFNVVFKTPFSCCCFVYNDKSFPKSLKEVTLNNELHILADEWESVVMLHHCLDITKEICGKETHS